MWHGANVYMGLATTVIVPLDDSNPLIFSILKCKIKEDRKKVNIGHSIEKWGAGSKKQTNHFSQMNSELTSYLLDMTTTSMREELVTCKMKIYLNNILLIP